MDVGKHILKRELHHAETGVNKHKLSDKEKYVSE